MIPKFLYCHECGNRMEIVNGEEIEPCWNCVQQARENAKAAVALSCVSQTAKEMEVRLVEIWAEYRENEQAHGAPTKNDENQD